MALTRSQQTPQASTSRAAGAATTSSSWLAIGYGVAIAGKITNGATGPTIGCSFWADVSPDGGTTVISLPAALHPVTANLVSTYLVHLGIGGAGGDWTHYRTNFGGNTAQAVTVQADASSTTAI